MTLSITPVRSRLNVATELLDAVVRRLGLDRPALASPHRGLITYLDLLGRANRVASVLTGELSVRPGDRVIVLGGTTSDTVSTLLGVLKAGGVAVPVDLARGVPLDEILRHTEPTLVLAENPETVPDIGVPVLGYGLGSDLATRMSRQPHGFPAADTAADAPAVITFAAGKHPGPAVHRHADLLDAATRFDRQALRLAADECVVTDQHPAGQYGLTALLAVLHAGACAVLLPKVGAGELVGLIPRYRANVLLTDPDNYRELLGVPTTGALGGLRACVSGAGTLGKATWDAWYSRTGFRLVDAFGTNQLLCGVIISDPVTVRPGSVGQAAAGWQVRVLDSAGNACPPCAPGRLALRGPRTDGWVPTGDLAAVDAEGHVWLDGRTENLLAIGGYLVSPGVVETVLAQHPAVQEVAVLARRCATNQGAAAEHDMLCAYVTLRPDAPASVERLRVELGHFAGSKLAGHEVPARIQVVDSMPHTVSGVVDRPLLAELIPYP
ncbi:hypothetical protein D5S17_19125 [Pseudonocardiaceae bacterium YIM PH 21723]|nr:hypothetical protein D5S17_19125 [Pseudonocardiaceae bacterium YIM PH 21723]